jgi:hypothetical protein
MGYEIPVFFAALDQKLLPSLQMGIKEIEAVLAENLGSPFVCHATSRNWWFIATLKSIQRGLNIGELSFVEDEWRILVDQELQANLAALDHLLATVTDGIPPLGEFELPSIEVMRLSNYSEVFDAIEPTQHINEYDFDNPAIAFFTFLKSIHHVMDKARQNELVFLWYRPHP